MTEFKPNSVNEVISILRAYGINARRMPERKKKSCDIVATSGRSNYFVEVKDRIGVTKPGKYVLKYGYNSSVNKVIETGIKQLQDMPGYRSVYNVLWLRTLDDDEEEFLLQGVLCTLYGIERVAFSRYDHEVEIDCFYVHPCAMKKYPLLVSAVIETKRGLIFCLNNDAPLLKAFKLTRMFKLHKRRDGVVDPLWLERHDCCVISAPPKNKEDPLLLLLKKSGFRSLRFLERKRHLGIGEPFTVRLPRSANKSVEEDRAT